MESTTAPQEPTRADFLAKQSQRSGDFTRLDSAEETASQKAFRIYEILESFFLCLPQDDLISCVNVSRSFQSVVRRSQGVQHSIFGNLPPNHDLVWKFKPSERYRGGHWQQIEAVHDSVYRHPIWTKNYHHRGLRYVTIPVVFNPEILSKPKFEHRNRSRRPRLQLKVRASPSSSESSLSRNLWQRVNADISGRSGEHFELLVDLPDRYLDTQLLETPLTEPAITNIQVSVEEPGSYQTRRKTFDITRPEGVCVKDIVAEVTKAGEEWYKQLEPSTKTRIYILDAKVTVVTRELYDMVENEGVVRERWRRGGYLNLPYYDSGATTTTRKSYS